MIRVGVVGIGFMGMTHFNAYHKVRGAKVVALCEQEPKRLAGDWRAIKGNFGPQGTVVDLSGIACYSEFEAMLADPNIDVIDICLPPAAHAATTVAALKAGKHVFCEKPIALIPADANRMVQAAQRAGKLLMIGHVLPFVPEFQFAYQAVTSGKYGQLLGGHFKRMISDPTWLTNFYDPQKTGGPALDLHIHDAHFIRLLFGMPKAVQTVGTLRGEVLERFSTQFIYESGQIVTASSGVIAQQGRPFTHAFEIYFEKATLLYDYAALPKVGDACTPLTVLMENGKVVRPKLSSDDMTDAFVAELAEVVRSAREEKPSSLLAGGLAKDALILCQKETESAQRGRAIKV